MDRRTDFRLTLTQALLMLASVVLELALLAPAAGAQVAPSAYRERNSIWVGGEYSNVRASFPYQSDQRVTGFGIFADYNWRGRIGAEGDFRFLDHGGFYGSTERSYLAGPRFIVLTWHRLQPYGKTLFGEGYIHYPFGIGDASYFAIAPGAGVNYRVSRRWTIRGEYEYQYWLNSPGYRNAPDHPLTPNGFHIGVAYRALPR